MSFDEALFGWVSNRLRGFRGRQQRLRAERAAKPELGRLGTLASAVAGFELECAVVDGPAGLSGRMLLLPRSLSILGSVEANEELLRVFAVFAGFRARTPARYLQPIEALFAFRSSEEALCQELPGWMEARERIIPGLIAERKMVHSGRGAALELLARRQLGDRSDYPVSATVAAFVQRALESRDLDADLIAQFEALGGSRTFSMPECWGESYPVTLGTFARPDATQLPRGVTREAQGKSRVPPKRRRTLHEHREAENPFTHSFEKVHTAEEYKGGHKRADGSDELSDHARALDELELDEVVISSESVASVYRAGMPSGDAALETASVGDLVYDEWDGRARRYLPGYCRVRVVRDPPHAAAGRALTERVSKAERVAIEASRAALRRAETALRWKSRQLDGPEIDVDAALERLTALRAGHEGSRHVYLARRRSARDLAVTLLIDGSMSTDAWVADRRVLDVERDAATIAGLAIDSLVDEVSVAAFSSDTHEDCRYVELKAFDEPWSKGFGRLAVFEPAGYTRIGPALRHATRELAKRHAKKRVLLVLTDGKPSDRDRYEGRHGEADVRQAIRESQRVGVEVMALGADPRAALSLATMFGHGSAAGLRRPGDIAAAITRICLARMAR